MLKYLEVIQVYKKYKHFKNKQLIYVYRFYVCYLLMVVTCTKKNVVFWRELIAYIYYFYIKLASDRNCWIGICCPIKDAMFILFWNVRASWDGYAALNKSHVSILVRFNWRTEKTESD